MYDESQLKSEFERLVQVLKDCGSRFFSNDTFLWEDLKTQRIRHFNERENARIFKEAEIAFKKQDWATVVKLLENKEEVLTPLNLGRLKYSRKKLINTYQGG